MTNIEKTRAIEELNTMYDRMKKAHEKGEDINTYFYAVLALQNAFKKIACENIAYDEGRGFYFTGKAIRYNAETCQYEEVK